MGGSKTKQKKVQKTAVLIIVAAVLALAALAYVYRDALFDTGSSGGDGFSEPYSYEYGANQQFALVDGQLAISSSTGLQILDEDGYSAIRQVFSMKNPALSASGESCVFYDVGGRSLRLYSDGEIIELDPGGNIISASMSSSGYFTVCSEQTGYKGAVTVYNNKGKADYKWYSGTGYVLDAALSPDGSRLAVLCLESLGSVIHLFKLDSEDSTGKITIPGELAFRLSFTENGSICALSESALRFYDFRGEELAAEQFGDLSIISYLLSENEAVILLSKYVMGSEAEILSFSPSGKLTGSAALSSPPLAVSPGEHGIMVLTNDTALVFADDMNLVAETKVPAGYNYAVYLPEGDCLLLSSYHGEKIPLK